MRSGLSIKAYPYNGPILRNVGLRLLLVLLGLTLGLSAVVAAGNAVGSSGPGFAQVSREVQSSLLVAPPGDVSLDGTVNHDDLRTVAGALGLTAPEPPWLDINGDDIVDILDLAIVAGHFGQSVGP